MYRACGVGVLIVFAKAFDGSEWPSGGSRQFSEHGRQLAEINRALGRLEGRQAAETSPAQT